MKVFATKAAYYNHFAVMILLIVKQKKDKIDEYDEELYHDITLHSTINIPETTF